MTEGPAPVGRRTCVPAADRLAHALHTGFDALPQRQRNMARFTFLDARLYACNHPHDPRLAELVGELSGRYEDLPTWWDGHGISATGDPDQILGVRTPEPATASDRALRRLAQWAEQSGPTGPVI